MTVAEVLTECGRRQVLATAEGDRLRLRGPAEDVAAVRGLVADHKAELLIALAAVCGGCSQGMIPDPLTAEGCGWAGCPFKDATHADLLRQLRDALMARQEKEGAKS